MAAAPPLRHRRARRRPRRSHRGACCSARAGSAGRRLRGRLPGRRDREDRRARRLPLRPRRAPVLHQGAVGAGDVGGDARRRVPRSGPGSRASTTAATTSPTRCAPRTSSGASASSRRSAASAPTWPRRCAAPSRRRRSRTGSRRRFGRRLYDAFFREYTEKVWGIPGSEIQAEWAAQRIRNLSFWTALTSALRLKRTPRDEPDRGVPLPAARARARCGRGSPRRSEERGHPRPARPPRHARVSTTRRASRAIEVARPGRRRARCIAVDGVVSSIPLVGARPLARPAAARRRRRRRRGGCATATSRRRADLDRPRAVPRQLDLPPRSRARGPGGCRTSAPGAPA